jgi:hypothetical protein
MKSDKETISAFVKLDSAQNNNNNNIKCASFTVKGLCVFVVQNYYPGCTKYQNMFYKFRNKQKCMLDLLYKNILTFNMRL